MASRKRTKPEPPRSIRYIGIDLAGAKNNKTCLATLEYYPKEGKLFLLDIVNGIGPEDSESGDTVLLEILRECGTNIGKIGINAALDLPPSLKCNKNPCPEKCNHPEVKYMRKIQGNRPSKLFTPYTQRPFEIYAKEVLLKRFSESDRFEVDETLGGNRAPLTARMHYLKKHMNRDQLVEVWPKLTTLCLFSKTKSIKNFLSTYRTMEDGGHARARLIEPFTLNFGVFIYDRDTKTIAQNLSAFDALMCAYTAFLADTEKCEKMPKDFPKTSTWVSFPREP